MRYGIGTDNIMCDDITCDDLHLASVAGVDLLTCDDQNPEFEIWDRIDDIMCDDITCNDLHLASVAGMDDITCDDLTYNELNPECEIMGQD